MSIDPKFVELTANVLKIFFQSRRRQLKSTIFVITFATLYIYTTLNRLNPKNLDRGQRHSPPLFTTVHHWPIEPFFAVASPAYVVYSSYR